LVALGVVIAERPDEDTPRESDLGDAKTTLHYAGNLKDEGLFHVLLMISPSYLLWDEPDGITVTAYQEGLRPIAKSILAEDFKSLGRRLDEYLLLQPIPNRESFENGLHTILDEDDSELDQSSILVVAINKGQEVYVYAIPWDSGRNLQPIIESKSRPLTIAEALATIVEKEGKEDHEAGWGEPINSREVKPFDIDDVER
jgi:hypothetical protein